MLHLKITNIHYCLVSESQKCERVRNPADSGSGSLLRLQVNFWQELQYLQAPLQLEDLLPISLMALLTGPSFLLALGWGPPFLAK